MKTDFSLMPTGRSGRPRRPIEIMMAPMIDVIFLLLVFFLATSSFQIPEKLLPSGVSEMSAQSGQSDRPPDPNMEIIDRVIIKGSYANGRATWTLNDIQLTDVTQLRNRLEALGKLQPDAPVIIDPDGQVPIGEVVMVYDAARQVGLSRVSMATRNLTKGVQ